MIRKILSILILASVAFSRKRARCGCNDFILPVRNPAICTPKEFVQTAIANTQAFIQTASSNNAAQISSEYGSTPVLVVEDDFCPDSACCSRYISMTVYSQEHYSSTNVTFFLFNPNPASYNPDGSVSVFGSEILSNGTSILAVRNVVWIWSPSHNTTCPRSSRCAMDLVQYRAIEYNCSADVTSLW